MIRISPKGNDINGFLHQYNATALCDTSSDQSASIPCTNALDPYIDYHWVSGTNANEWFQFSIPNIFTRITHYSIQVPSHEKYEWYAPKSWKFFGIKKDNAAIELDVIEEGYLEQSLAIKTFPVSSKEYFSSFKIEMTGLNYGNLRDFRIYKIDIFGSFRSYQGNTFPCVSRKTSKLIVFFIILCI